MPDNVDTRRGSQQPSKGIMPQCRNATSFSKTHQPAPKTKGAAIKRDNKKRTQAQQAMNDAGFNPIQQQIGLAQKYERMIINQQNWIGGKATAKEMDTYAASLLKINEGLAKYFSSTAPVETSFHQDPIEDSVTSDAPVEILAPDAPLTQKELASTRRDMIKRLDDKF